MGWKARRIAKLQTQAQEDKDRDALKSYTPFRLMERACRRFHHSSNPLLPHIDPSLLEQATTTCDPEIDPSLLEQAATTTCDPEIDGLRILRGHLSVQQQRLLVKQSLMLHNPSNLDKHYHVPDTPTIWDAYSSWRLDSRHSGLDENSGLDTFSKHSDLDTFSEPQCLDEPLLQPKVPGERKPIPISRALREIRWKILGHSYDWTSFSYTSQESLHTIPPLISDLVLHTLDSAGLNTRRDYICQAGIVNFYGLKDSLMGHQDKSEEDSTAPLVSYSLGHSCVFLLGTETRDTRPVPIVLNSGDALILYSNARMYFHGVPRILENTLPLYLYPSAKATQAYISENIDERRDFLRFDKLMHDLSQLRAREVEQQDSDDEDWDLYGSYMLESRINVNIRKVFA
ncbi:MAG: hypothetical protein SGCHY_000209 [Lobulomycetales sp.]